MGCYYILYNKDIDKFQTTTSNRVVEKYISKGYEKIAYVHGWNVGVKLLR